jgi:DNA primase small subunit
VCVPIDGQYPERFNPLTVPTVTELLSEIDAWDSEHQTRTVPPADAADGDGSVANESDAGATRQLHDFEKTRLKPYIDYFRSFIAELIRNERSSKRERNEDVPTGGPEAMEF